MSSTVIAGDTTIWTIPIVDRQNQPVNLTGHAVWVTVKSNVTAPDEDALYQHAISIDAQGQVEHAAGMRLGDGGAASGIVVQELTPAESRAFIAGTYTYDVQVMLPSGRIYTLINGETEVVVGDITFAITRPGGA